MHDTESSDPSSTDADQRCALYLVAARWDCSPPESETACGLHTRAGLDGGRGPRSGPYCLDKSPCVLILPL